MAQSLRFGVRMPALMAKVDAKLTGNNFDFLLTNRDDTAQTLMVPGFVLS